jgi:murein DD-endopeptidase MepM/ murein hydrolase activator NlpD
MEQISGSVGLGGTNDLADVILVQSRLNLHRSNIIGAREITVDGIVGPSTINAIRIFQQSIVKLQRLDGLVQQGGKTFQALAIEPTILPPQSVPLTVSVIVTGLRFPLAKRPKQNYHNDGTNYRYFGAPRDKGKRRHAGCDLIASVGTEILSIADGTVTGHYIFYQNTQALEISHDCKLLARYGEIKGLAHGVKVG